MKYIVTGGLGFIGYHLTKRLLEEGHSVIIVDDYRGNFQERLDSLLKIDEDRLFVHKLDLSENPSGIRACLYRETPVLYKGTPVRVFHLAGNKGSSFSPIGSHELARSTLSTINLVEALEDDIESMVFVSTGDVVLSNNTLDEISEQYNIGLKNVNDPRGCYITSKIFGEMYLLNNTIGFDIMIARLQTVFGPMMSGTHEAVSAFINSAISKGMITVATPYDKRPWSYIDDVVDGLLTLMDVGVSGEVYNVCSPHSRTVKYLAKAISVIFDNGIEIDSDYTKKGSTYRIHDTSKIEELGWSEKVGFEEGLRRTIEWNRSKNETRKEAIATSA